MRSTFERALSAAAPEDALLQLARGLKAEGWTQERVYALFMTHHLRCRAEGREAAEDQIADVMDYICGFCGVNLRLFP